MKAYWQLLQQPMRERALQGKPWLGLFLWCLLVLLLVLQSLVHGSARRPLSMVCILVTGAAISLWWQRYVSNAQRQNLPANAVLVPHLRARLMKLTALLWLGCTLLLAAVCWLGFGHFGYAFVGFGGALLLLAGMAWLRWLALVPALLSISTMLGVHQPYDAMADAIAALGEPVASAAGLLALAATGAYLLRAIFPHGGERHWSTWRRIGQAATAAAKGELPARDGARSLSTLWDRGYLALLRRDCALTRTAAGASASGTAGRMLLYALGPRAHWSGAVLSSVVLATAGAALGWYQSTRGPGAPMIWSPVILVMWLLPVPMHVAAVRLAMHEKRAEQALLRLAPVAPAAQGWNRQLGHALLRQLVLVWAVGLASMLAADLALGRGLHPAVSTVVAATVGVLVGAGILRDYAAAPAPARQAGYGPAPAVLVTLAAPVAFGQWLDHPLHLALAGMALAACGLARMAMRWRRMCAAPPAFPAGRLAQ
ncbi:hypothetical protein ACLB1G_02775 [Oxalobacteraceae bacterium A2-2]